MTEIEAWIEEHTFQCPIGRVTPDQCRALRSRPSIKECAELAWPAVPPRPRVCEECHEWQEKIRSIGVQKESVKTCKTCGRELPLSEFHKDSKGEQGRKASCKECLNQRKRNIHKQRNLELKNSEGLIGSAGSAAACLETRSATMEVTSVLTLDFTNYPDLVERINEAARYEMRTPDMQAMWMIKMYLDADDEEEVS